MALIDFLFNKGANKLYNDMQAVENYADMQKAEALKSKLKPVLVPLQMDATGGLDAEATKKVQDFVNSPEARQQVLDERLAQAAAQKATPWQKVWGRDLTADIQTVDPQTNAVTMETKSLHQPGYFEKAGQGLKRGLNDILGGYGENRTQNFSTNNWNNNYLDNGNKKGLAYKLGEGLGSFAKLAESPLGRSLLVGGIVGASGGSGLEALSYGAQTGMLNQANRMKDQMYRNSLFESAKSSIMGSDLSEEEKERQIAEVANRINSYRGYVGDDTYKQILAGMQLKDNAEYKNALLASQLRNQDMAMQQRQDELAYRRQQDAIENNRENRKLDIAEGKIKKGTQKFRTAIGDKKGALQQIQEMRTLVKNNPKATGYVVGKFAKGQEASQKIANEFLSSDPEAIKTRSAIAKLRGTTMHDLAGTAQTLQEQRNLAPFLPDTTDNAKTILAKLDQLEAELKREMAGLMNTGYELGYDIEDFDNSSPNTQAQVPSVNNDKSLIVEKLRAKGYSENDIAEYLKMKGL